MLGVLFTIPLRRALVTNSDLPYPEGVAAAEVLKVGSGTRGETKDETGEAREGLIAVILGSVASAGLAIVTATRIAAAELSGLLPPRGDGIDRIQHRLVARACSARAISSGLSVGMAMLAGLVIAWVIAVPILTSMQPAAEGVTLAAHTIDDLAHAGPVHRRRRDRGRGDLHAGQAREAGRRRTREHARRVSRATATTTIRDRDLSPQWILGAHGRVPRHRRRGWPSRSRGRRCSRQAR